MKHYTREHYENMSMWVTNSIIKDKCFYAKKGSRTPLEHSANFDRFCKLLHQLENRSNFPLVTRLYAFTLT